MKEINRIKLYLNLLTLAFNVIPICLHKPFRLDKLSDRLADLINKTLETISDPTARFYVCHFKKLESLKEIDIARIKYHNYLINKHYELTYTYNRIIGFNTDDEMCVKTQAPINHEHNREYVDVDVIADEGDYEPIATPVEEDYIYDNEIIPVEDARIGNPIETVCRDTPTYEG